MGDAPLVAVPEIRTVGELLHWSYANLAMAHAAVTQEALAYGRTHFIIRARLYKGLRTGTMTIGPLADDERLKLVLPQACAYCGTRERLSADHIVPRAREGPDVGDNLIWACRACNSSKGARDLLAWLEHRGEFPPLLLLRRYLKLAVEMCVARGVMDRFHAEVTDLPMDLTRVPQSYPAPALLKLWTVAF
jgi:hypothetical protein